METFLFSETLTQETELVDTIWKKKRFGFESKCDFFEKEKILG